MENETIIDERVLNYIKRAWEIVLQENIFVKNSFKIDSTIEIAKMIQKEEFRNNGLYFKD